MPTIHSLNSPAQQQAPARGTDARCPPLYGTVHATVQPPSRDPRIKFVTFGGDEDLRQSAVNLRLSLGLISPRRLFVRATTIMNACGGEPTQADLVNPSPRTQAARNAWYVIWYLVHARDALVYLHHPRPIGVASMRWRYRAHAGKRDAAKFCIATAGKHLVEAERIYASVLKPAARSVKVNEVAL